MRAAILAAAILASAATLQGSAQAQDLFRVTLLGTGTPTPRLDRLGPATLVEAGNEKLLFDAGRGIPIRLAQIQIPEEEKIEHVKDQGIVISA